MSYFEAAGNTLISCSRGWNGLVPMGKSFLSIYLFIYLSIYLVSYLEAAVYLSIYLVSYLEAAGNTLISCSRGWNGLVPIGKSFLTSPILIKSDV